ncbi:MAG: hypothetical protein GC205_11540 [Bacteroidetes bacterium]|nr:hypothetical protein [Bacteroidota bacterium]
MRLSVPDCWQRGFALFALLSFHNLCAQPAPSESIEQMFNQSLDQAAEFSDAVAESALDALSQILDQLAQQPLDLNRNEAADWQPLVLAGLLSESQLEELFNHRHRYGLYLSPYELQTLPRMDLATLRQLLPLVTVGRAAEHSTTPWSRQWFGGDNQLFLRASTVLEPQAGFRNSDSLPGYAGDRSKLYLRYQYNFGNRIRYGFTAEKDPGEGLFGPAQRTGFDFYSGHIYVRDVGVVKDLCFGDYEVGFGQGLVWGAGFGLRKNAAVIGGLRAGRPIGAYTSVGENRFLRGAAARIGLGTLELTVFASHKAVDANVVALENNPDSLGMSETGTDPESIGAGAESPDGVSAFPDDGLHRTETEWAKKDAARETAFGAHLLLRRSNWKLGLLASHLRYNTFLEPSDQLYAQYNFSGNQLSHASLHGSGTWRNLSFFGEAALSQNGGLAAVAGVMASLHPRVDLSVISRRYAPQYQSLYASAFAEQSSPRNEHGIYFGLRVRPFSRITLDAYADAYTHPWLRFGADAPSRGRDYLAQLAYAPSRNTLLYLRARHEVKEENAPANEAALDYLTGQRRSSLRLNLSARLSPQLRLQSRIEAVWAGTVQQPFPERDTTTTGLLLFQDLQWTPARLPLSLTVRYALFDAQSFDARLYAFENDVLYSFSVPFFQDRGSRYYAVTRIRLARWLDLYLRYARTSYQNRENIGSGLDLIEAPHKSEVKAMLRVKW